MSVILHPTAPEIARAAALLAAGELVAFGTETVYGLGADARNGEAVANIYAAKGRPSFNPLICHYASARAAFAHVVPNAMAEKLAAAFWPGPLTMVLPRAAACPVARLAAAGLETLAVRVPAHPVALQLLAAFGGPVAAPSANRSGRISPTTAAHVLAGLGGKIAAVVDSGPCAVGVESTVLDLSGPAPVLLRPGGVSVETLEVVIGPVGTGAPMIQGQAMASPGMLASHYAPGLPVRLNAGTVAADEALLAFGPPLPGAKLVFQLSAMKNLTEAAARLFEALHELDASGAALGLTRIAVMPVPNTGLGRAINDRLSRAAAPRG
ncbi:L-threonylcarbamoyladenylate synthase [Acidocella sp.]|uniref:L-threonylcarbamoyladenylate synthase n=1 Tax=Acidocella sp. TaxID=50710 RepID=UPI0026183E29|nr:L-threonylcarbamoyladenylate synthase [Acidocella sp.]MDD2795903.1 L-threonylcarbamoyladenylate synthase [Acidocella sp.]